MSYPMYMLGHMVMNNLVFQNIRNPSVIIKYMKDRGIKNIEGLIITHFDNDHSGGASDIIDYAKVKKVYINTFDDKGKTSKEIYNRTIFIGAMAWRWDK